MNKQRVFVAAIWITLISAFSKVLGLVRESLFAAYYGANSATDAFKIAYSIPAVFFFIFSAAIAQVFIPIYSGIQRDLDPERTKRFVNNLYTIIIIFVGSLIFICCFFRRQMVVLIAPGFDQATLELAAFYTVMLMPAALFQVLSNVTAGVLQYHNRFIAPALVWYPYNVIVIISMILFHQKGLAVFAAATLIGYVGMVLIQLPSMKSEGLVYRPVFDLKDENIRKMLVLIIPVIIGISFNQLSGIVNRILASGLESGSISALDYANKISTLVYTTFVLSLAAVVFPSLSRLSEDHYEFTRLLGKELRITLLVVLPLTALFFVLRVPIIELIYRHGKFGASETMVTATAFGGLALGMCGFAFRELLNRAFFALSDTRTPMINGIYVIMINIIVAVVLVRFMGLLGIALASSIAFTASACMLLIRLRKKIGNIRGKWIFSGFCKTLLASLCVALTVWGVEIFLKQKLYLESNIVRLLVNLTLASIAGFLTYVGVLWVLGMEELKEGLDYFKKTIVPKFTECK